MSRLQELWLQRGELSQQEIGELWELMVAVLKRSTYPIVESMHDSVEHYIQEYFMLKVVDKAKTGERLYYDSALKTFFRRYLINEKKSENKIKEVLLGDKEITSKKEDVTLLQEERPSKNKNIFITNESDKTKQKDELLDAGLMPDKVRSSARKFLQTNADWVRLYLGYYMCPDTEKQPALSTFAKVRHISNYHNRAKKLGIPGKNKKDTFWTGYEKTIIGQWIRSLNIDIQIENYPIMKCVLELLCEEALDIVNA